MQRDVGFGLLNSFFPGWFRKAYFGHLLRKRLCRIESVVRGELCIQSSVKCPLICCLAIVSHYVACGGAVILWKRLILACLPVIQRIEPYDSLPCRILTSHTTCIWPRE